MAELHPVFVHFPIAFFMLYTVMMIWNVFLKGNYFNLILPAILLLGVAAGILSVMSGNQSAYLINNNSSLLEADYIDFLNEHERFATITLWYYSILTIVHYYFLIKRKIQSTQIKILLTLASVAGIVFIYLTGHYGGILVYEFGIGTKLLN